MKGKVFLTVVLCAVHLQNAHAAIGGSATFYFLQNPVVIYENRDTTAPITIDLSIANANDNFVALTVSWTDAAGNPQTLLLNSTSMAGPRSAGVRTTLPAAGGTLPTTVSVTSTQTVQFTWTVDSR